MPIEILMPALSPTMEQGKLAKWLVKEGDKVTSGKVIAEIETDKATMEVEAVEEGTVGRILVPEGAENIKVNQPIALLLEEGESASALEGARAGVAAPMAASASQAKPGSQPRTQPAPGRAAAEPTQPPVPEAAPRRAGGNGHVERIFASPLARRLAKERGIDLGVVTGSGPHGRIIKRDIERAAAGAASGPTALQRHPGPPTPMPAPATIEPMPDDKVLALYEKGTYELVPHDAMRRIIAQRLTQAKTTIPHFYLSIDCRIDELLRARERMNAAAPKSGPRAYKLSVNDFIIKAMALALQQVPAANATWTEGGMLRHRHSDVGVAVAVEGGLFTPIVRHAELKTLGEISNEMKDLADRARKRRLAPHEYQGGTTSISNLGMYGIKNFDAVINPPHATILAVGTGEKRAVVIDDHVQVATIMSCTLSCDHRVVDGALGAELLNAFRNFIEDPVRMLV
ncbi:MAG TPA: pyruvate dehydrogenase complex dihydrolipoamide acetyltransferase [Hyphomicrobiaceae bacterium]|nr:pyruvate dehydrogenase complex dihydrolipoamide acetyltransferase [Hyphomicrobiaceae bacterium]